MNTKKLSLAIDAVDFQSNGNLFVEKNINLHLYNILQLTLIQRNDMSNSITVVSYDPVDPPTITTKKKKKKPKYNYYKIVYNFIST